MNELVILCGLPGSGKSSYTKNLQFSNYVRLSSDDYIEEIARKLEKTYNDVFSSTIREANKVFKEKLEYYSKSNESVIIDRTNLSIKTRKNLIQKFKNHQATIIYFDVPLSVIKERNTRLGKIFSNELLESMHENLEPPTESEALLVTIR